MKMKLKKKYQAQVLLIVIMVLATVITVVLSVSFQTITDTKITKLEEENQKTLAAAEAAIEAALKENNTVILGQGSLSSFAGFQGQATFETVVDNKFETSLIDKDNSYTFYLGDYDINSYQIGSSIAENIEICFQQKSTNPALEITLVKTSGVKKYLIDPSSRINNASSPSNICNGNSSYNYSYTIPGTDIGNDSKLIVIRVLFQSSKLAFFRNSPFPLQGKTISSSAVSQKSGVSKKITLFQTYPQIPPDFFYTSF